MSVKSEPSANNSYFAAGRRPLPYVTVVFVGTSTFVVALRIILCSYQGASSVHMPHRQDPPSTVGSFKRYTFNCRLFQKFSLRHGISTAGSLICHVRHLPSGHKVLGRHSYVIQTPSIMDTHFQSCEHMNGSKKKSPQIKPSILSESYDPDVSVTLLELSCRRPRCRTPSGPPPYR